MKTTVTFVSFEIILSLFLLTACISGNNSGKPPPVNTTPGQATVTVTPTSGGQITIQSSTGVQISLEIPPNAVSSTVEVSIAEQPNTGSIPLAGQVAVAVNLEPEGLQFSSLATLTVKSLPLPAVSIPVGYQANNNGSDFRFLPVTKSGSDLRIDILHFSNVGILDIDNDAQMSEFFNQSILQFDQLISDISMFTSFDEIQMYALFNRSTDFAGIWDIVNNEFPAATCKTPIETKPCSNFDDLYTQSALYLKYKIEENFDAMNALCAAGDQSKETEMIRWIIKVAKFSDITSAIMSDIDLRARRTCGIKSVQLDPQHITVHLGGTVDIFADVRDLNDVPLNNREIVWQAVGRNAVGNPDNTIFTLSYNGQNATVHTLAEGQVLVFGIDKVIYDSSNIANPNIPALEEALRPLFPDNYISTNIGIENSLQISPAWQDLRPSQLATFDASLYVNNTLQSPTDLIWKVADLSIADIDSISGSTATIYAKNEGDTTITVQDPNSGMSATAKISVSGLHISITPDQACLHPLDTQQFTATIRDKNGRKLDLYTPFWQSSNSATAPINNSTGLVIASQEGDATITARVTLDTDVSFEGSAQVHVPTFPDDLRSTRVISEQNSSPNVYDLILTNDRKLVHLNYSDNSVKHTIITRAAENGLDIIPNSLIVIDANNNGQALVTYGSSGPLLMNYDSSTYTELIPPAVGSLYPIAMNDNGDVLLNMSIVDQHMVMYIYKDGIFTTVLPPAPYTDIEGKDISNNNTVVGYLSNSGQGVGFIYKDGSFTLLTTPITSPSGTLPTLPQFVNDDGLIINNISYMYYQGTSYSFLPLYLLGINNASDIYLTEYAPTTFEYIPYIYHLCPLQ